MDRKTFGLATLLLAGCDDCDNNTVPLDSGITESVPADTGTGSDSGLDTDTPVDSGTGTGTDSAVDTGLDVVTALNKTTCESLSNVLMPNDLSNTQYVESLGAAATYTGRTFQDTRFEATVKDEIVGACVYNGEGTAADETRVIRVPATETDPDTLTVEADIDMSGGALLLQFVTPETLWAAQNAEDTNPAWIYSAGAGEVDDLQY